MKIIAVTTLFFITHICLAADPMADCDENRKKLLQGIQWMQNRCIEKRTEKCTNVDVKYSVAGKSVNYKKLDKKFTEDVIERAAEGIHGDGNWKLVYNGGKWVASWALTAAGGYMVSTGRVASGLALDLGGWAVFAQNGVDAGGNLSATYKCGKIATGSVRRAYRELKAKSRKKIPQYFAKLQTLSPDSKAYGNVQNLVYDVIDEKYPDVDRKQLFDCAMIGYATEKVKDRFRQVLAGERKIGAASSKRDKALDEISCKIIQQVKSRHEGKMIAHECARQNRFGDQTGSLNIGLTKPMIVGGGRPSLFNAHVGAKACKLEAGQYVTEQQRKVENPR